MRLVDLTPALRTRHRNDAIQLILDIRAERRVPKKVTIERAKKAKSTGVVTKSGLNNIIKGLTPAEAMSLFQQLSGGK